ncbi:hypothetical protein [Thiothrix lacustris]|nr:hypothetical protein [Thiothrix lacustris]
MPANYAERAATQGVTVVPDTTTLDRRAILYADTLAAAQHVATALRHP